MQPHYSSQISIFTHIMMHIHTTRIHEKLLKSDKIIAIRKKNNFIIYVSNELQIFLQRMLNTSYNLRIFLITS